MTRVELHETNHHILPKELAGKYVEVSDVGVIFVSRQGVRSTRNVVELPRVLHVLSHWWWAENLVDENLVRYQLMGLGGLTGRMTSQEIGDFVYAKKKAAREGLDPLWQRWKFEDLKVRQNR